MIKSFYWAEMSVAELKDDSFKDTYGTIIENLKLKGSAIYFYPFYMARRLVFALCVLIMYEYPVLQLIVMILITIIPVLPHITLRCSFTLFLFNLGPLRKIMCLI